MHSLRELQLRFGAGLLDAAAGYAGAWILDKGIEPDTRIGFYRNNVLSNYRDALRASFAVTEQLVGERYFERLADEFVRTHPSTSGDLNDFGGEFPDFLLAHEVGKQLPYLPDVAGLEWRIDEAFRAADRPPLDFAMLAEVPPDRREAIGLSLHPSCRLFASDYPVRHIWEIHQPDYSGNQTVDLAEGGVLLLIRRSGFEVVLETLTPGAKCLLESLQRGAGLGDALRRTCEIEIDFDAAGFLQRQARAGTFVDFDRPI